VIVRGLDFPFNAGNIQVLLNGVAVARQDGGFNTSVLLIPVEQIDRIEVIRGPGSVVYGDFAFMGLVNIITRKQGMRFLGRSSTPHASHMGAVRIGSKPNAPLAYSVNASGFTSSDVEAPLTAGESSEHRSFAIGNVAYRGLTFTAQRVHRDFTTANGAATREKTWDAEAKYSHELRRALRAEATVTYLHNDIAEPVDVLIGDLARIGVNVTWSGFRHHSILAGADYSRSTLDDAFHAPPPAPGQPPNTPQLLAHDVHREITGVVLQDQLDLGDQVTLTLGGRYDRYSDLDSRFTPRVSLVWRVNERHIVKAQYAEGFRPPTFFEFYQPPAPGTIPRYPFETNATSELNYVYRNTGRVGRVTLFHSMLSDMLRPGGVVVAKDAWAQGGEFEWTQEFGEIVKAAANVSYAETFDPRVPGGGGANPVSSKWLGNLSLLYRAIPNVVIGARHNFNGGRVAGKGFRTTDFTISRQDVFLPGLALRIGMKNAFNSDVTYLTARPTGQVGTSEWPRRSVWVQVGWKG
jgi:iron complex outermembrane receptor protein